MRNKNALLAAVVSAVVSITTMVALLPFAGQASQGSAKLATTGIFNGLTEQNAINNALDALMTCNLGNAAPTNSLSGAAEAGQCWIDNTSATLLVKKRYSGSAWVIEGIIDVTNGVWTPPVGGGIGSLASAATTNLGSVPQAYKTISGTTTITSFGSSAAVGSIHALNFTGALTITYNATSLIVPSAANITTVAGDIAIATYLGSGNWRILVYAPANGNSLITTAHALGETYYGTFGTIPAKAVRGQGQALARASFPAYLAAVTRAQTMTRTSGNATLTSVADTSSMGVGMPLEGSGINAGCTIASLVLNTSITLNSSTCVTASGAATLTVFFTGYGSGGSGSTVGVIDCRGKSLIGLDPSATVLTSATMTPDGKTMLATGGGQTSQLVTNNLPAYTPSGSISGTVSVTSNANAQNAGGTIPGGGSFTVPLNGAASVTATFSGSYAGNAQGGSSALFTNLPPSVGVECVQQVLP